MALKNEVEPNVCLRWQERTCVFRHVMSLYIGLNNAFLTDLAGSDAQRTAVEDLPCPVFFVIGSAATYVSPCYLFL